MDKPSPVFLTSAISSRWALMIAAQTSRSFSISAYHPVPMYTSLMACSAYRLIASALTRGIARDAAVVEKVPARSTGKASAFPIRSLIIWPFRHELGSLTNKF